MLILLLIVFFENGLSLVVIQIKSSFIVMSFSAAKLIHFATKTKYKQTYCFIFIAYVLVCSWFIVISLQSEI